ncbi:unnamed protein product [Calypogeia fissa]
MANEEAPMLQQSNEEEQIYKGEKSPESKHAEEKVPVENHEPEAVCGLPVGRVGEGVVMGEPVPQPRQPWSTGFLSCLGSNDEFCMSDMQVCLLGWVAPCVLYASNMERLNAGEDSFMSHCMAYSSLFAMGNFLFGANSLAPCFSFPGRVAIRKAHNLQGHGENFVKSIGCCSGLINSEEDREHCDSFCDFTLHFCCHQCALCQEGREIRRRAAPRGQMRHYYMAPPSQQTME